MNTRLKPANGRQGLEDGILGPELSLHFGVFSMSPTAPTFLSHQELTTLYSVCSLVVPTLEEAILTSVLKKNFK